MTNYVQSDEDRELAVGSVSLVVSADMYESNFSRAEEERA